MLDKQTTDKVQKFRDEIEKSKKTLAQAEGSMQTVLKTVKDGFGITSLDDAKKRRNEIAIEKGQVEKRILDKVKEVESTYEMD